MDTTSVKCLTNSISRFIHLVSCLMIKPMVIQKDYMNMVRAVKILKSILDDVVDYKILGNEILYRNCEELDIEVNEAREFLEKWSPKMSKILSVTRSEALFVKIQRSSLEISEQLCRLTSSTSSLISIQQHMKDLHILKHEGITKYIEDAGRSERDHIVSTVDNLQRVIDLLGLTSNQELLKESVAVEKERSNAEFNNTKGELDQIIQIVDFISQIRNYMLTIVQADATTGVQIPSYFRCPLSLELMLDPVIVASGQTYDRTSIQKWLEHGLTICPKTRQTLNHTNLITNYTVKAMIDSWLKENNSKDSSIAKPTKNVALQDLIHTDSFCSLQSSNSTSRSSFEVGNGFETQKTDISSKMARYESHERSYVHSRSESASSAISSIEYVSPVPNDQLRMPNEFSYMNFVSGEITAESPDASFSTELRRFACNGNHNNGVAQPYPFSESATDDLTTASHVKAFIEFLNSQSNEVQTNAAAQIRLLSKQNMENRVLIGRCGAIPPLLLLLYSQVKLTQEHAVTALLNLSINEENKNVIAESGAIEPLIHVLRSGNDGARENSAATLSSLSTLEEFKAKIGRSAAIKALVDLLQSGTLRGKKDATTALFNLSIFHENKARIVQAGAVKPLVELMNPESGMADKAVALLANLSTIGEGRLVIAREGGIPILVEIVESGSERGKENAASVLLQLCINSSKFCTLVLQEGAVPPLVALSQSGNPRAKEKAQQLLSHFRNQRGGSIGKKKP